MLFYCFTKITLQCGRKPVGILASLLLNFTSPMLRDSCQPEKSPTEKAVYCQSGLQGLLVFRVGSGSLSEKGIS